MRTSLKRGPLADLSTPKDQKPGDQGKKTGAQLFEGRLALNLGLNLTRVSFSFIQKHFLG